MFNTAALEDDSFVPDVTQQIALPNGPTGLALDDGRHRLYVATRFDDRVTVVNTLTRAVIASAPLFDPEPAPITTGRRFLYDATLSSSNGEISCASCHVFGDTDHLAWDLGNPDANVVWNLSPSKFIAPEINAFHPLKGPMTTQTFRGIGTQGPMHWRGDRSGVYEPGGDAGDEAAAFRQFNEAFVSLMGRATPLAAVDMAAFADFAIQIAPPPNPNRPLDHGRTASQQAGGTEFLECTSTCHTIDATQGFFGTDGTITVTDAARTQIFKIPHLDNLFQKVGLFAMNAPFNEGDISFTGPQIRGFGYLHDGSQGFPPTISSNLLEFLLAFDTRYAPIVGQEITLTATNPAAVAARLDLLIARAAIGECDLVVRGVHAGRMRGWLRESDGWFRSDRITEPRLDDASLRSQAATAGAERTYLCAPPGTGVRLALDRDEDGIFDTDERDAGSDPADPGSVPGSCTAPLPLSPASLHVSHAGAPLGDEAIVLRGTAPLGALAGGSPAEHGLIVTIADDAGHVLWTRSLPGGARWTVASTSWKFIDDGTAADGVRKATVTRGRTAMKLTLAGKGLAFAVPAALGPLRLEVHPTADAVCTQAMFGVAGATGPMCQLKHGGATLACR